MNKQKRAILSNFCNHGVTRANVSFFGRELDISTIRETALSRMLATFGHQQLLRHEPSVFGRSVQELVGANNREQVVNLADLVNASLAHIDFAPASELMPA